MGPGSISGQETRFHILKLSICMPQLNDPSNFPGGPVAKNLPANAGDTEDMGSIPGSGRTPGEGNDTLLQYSCLEKSMNRRAWQARAAKTWTQLSIHTHTGTFLPFSTRKDSLSTLARSYFSSP